MTVATMDKCIKILLTCLLFTHICADQFFLYKFSWIHTILPGPDFPETKLTYELELLWKPLNNSNSDYYQQLQSINVSIQTGNSEKISLNTCPTFQKVLEDMKQPFYGSFPVDLFQHMQVPPNHENLSVNLKLLYNVALQLNTSALAINSTQYSTKDSEIKTYGACDVNYDISKNGSVTDPSTLFLLNKTFDMNSCSNINKTATGSFNNICNPICEKNLQIDLKEYWSLQNMIYDETVLQNECYNPWKSSSAKICSNVRADFEFISIVNDSTITTSPPPDNYDVITELRYSEPVNSLIDIESSDPLQKVYSALACDYNSNYVMELYGHAIQCSKA